MKYSKNYCEEKGISTSELTEPQRTLYYIAENMKMDKSISEEGYRHFQMAIKALEQQSCEDCISRQAVLDYAKDTCVDLDKYEDTEIFCDEIKALPPVTPKYTDEEIDRAQAVEQAYIDKMVELTVEELKRPKGKWIDVNGDKSLFECSKCGDKVCCANNNYCPNCGSYNGGGEE